MKPRMYTIREDEFIMRHARGEFGIRELQNITKSSRKRLNERAKELGVELKAREPRGTIGKSKILYEQRPEDGNPFVCTVGEDPLLAALKLHHPMRIKK